MNGKTKFAVIGGGSWATAIKNVINKSLKFRGICE
jgi:glycerol-3-phosphate dehydrogenase